MQHARRNVFKRINEMILLFVKKKCCKRKKRVLNKLLTKKVVNKVEYSRVNIFNKEKHFFANFYGNINL